MFSFLRTSFTRIHIEHKIYLHGVSIKNSLWCKSSDQKLAILILQLPWTNTCSETELSFHQIFTLQFANMVLKLLSDIGWGCIIGEVIFRLCFVFLYVYICTGVQIFIGIYMYANVTTCACKIFKFFKLIYIILKSMDSIQKYTFHVL